MLKRLLAAAAIATAVTAPTASATPSLGEAEHNLMNTINSAGVTVYTECPDNVNFAGVYVSSRRVMAVCVEGRDPSEWTADERDTLRHEAVHLVQDCMGRLGDDRLDTAHSLYNLMRIASTSGLDLQAIEAAYRRHGADDMTVMLEWEAFSLAATRTAEQIEAMVIRACPTR